MYFGASFLAGPKALGTPSSIPALVSVGSIVVARSRWPPDGRRIEAGPPVQIVGVESRAVRGPCVAAFPREPPGVRYGSRSHDSFAPRFDNAGARQDRRPRHPSGMTDAEWAVAPDAFPVPAWMNGRGR